MSTDLTTLTVKAVADAITQEGVPVNQFQLFAWLREHGWLCRARGRMWNQPTKHALEMGWLRAVERPLPTNHGDVVKWTPYVTGLGQVELIEGFTTGRFTISKSGVAS